MAGLLDFLQGDEAALGFGLLAAGAPSTDPNMGFGARLAGAQQMVKANQAAALKNKLLQSQLAENESQAAYRAAQVQDMQRKQAGIAEFLQRFQGGAPAPGGPAMGGAQPGLLNGGVGGVPVSGGSPMGAAPPTGVRGLSVDDLAAAKIAGLPDLTEIAKISLPKWEFQNNTWINTNDPSFKGGPSEGVMNTPQGPMRLQLGPNGQPYVTPVAGSLEALTAAEDRKNVSAAKASESGKPVYDEATGRWVTRSKADVLGLQEPAAAPAPRVTLPGRPFGALPGYGTETQMKGTVAGDMGADPAAARREIAAIERDLAAPGKVPDQASRQMLAAQANDLRRQLGNIEGAGGGAAGAGRGSGGAVVQLSASEEAANKARERLQTGVAEAAAANIKGSQEQAQSAADTLRNVDQIRSGINEAILGPGANARVSMLQIGQVLGVGGKDAAQTLSNTRNVIQGLARQELSAAGQMKGQGQITENEREILRRAEAGKISDLTKLELQTLLSGFEKPANYRLKSHEDLLGRVKGGASPTDLMSVPTTSRIEPKAAKPGGASGEWSGGKNIVPDLPKTAPVGARARDTVTGKILKFDGMMWKPE